MRYSLRTLIVVVIFIGGLIGSWVNRQPWVVDATVNSEQAERMRVDALAKNRNNHFRCWDFPDGRMADLHFERMGETIWSDIAIATDTRVLYRFDDARVSDIVVIDNDRIVTTAFPDTSNTSAIFRVLYRRFPEYWWGHFYRFEVWTAILSAIGLIVLAVRRIRSGRKAAA